jgi:putative SOS response-associated peptidase YedK
MPSGRKARYWIGMKDKAPFALAGLWKELADPKTGERKTWRTKRGDKGAEFSADT